MSFSLMVWEMPLTTLTDHRLRVTSFTGGSGNLDGLFQLFQSTLTRVGVVFKYHVERGERRRRTRSAQHEGQIDQRTDVVGVGEGDE